MNQMGKKTAQNGYLYATFSQKHLSMAKCNSLMSNSLKQRMLKQLSLKPTRRIFIQSQFDKISSPII